MSPNRVKIKNGASLPSKVYRNAALAKTGKGASAASRGLHAAVPLKSNLPFWPRKKTPNAATAKQALLSDSPAAASAATVKNGRQRKDGLKDTVPSASRKPKAARQKPQSPKMPQTASPAQRNAKPQAAKTKPSQQAAESQTLITQPAEQPTKSQAAKSQYSEQSNKSDAAKSQTSRPSNKSDAAKSNQTSSQGAKSQSSSGSQRRRPEPIVLSTGRIAREDNPAIFAHTVVHNQRAMPIEVGVTLMEWTPSGESRVIHTDKEIVRGGGNEYFHTDIADVGRDYEVLISLSDREDVMINVYNMDGEWSPIPELTVPDRKLVLWKNRS